MAALIELRDISKSYHMGEADVPALQDVNLQVDEGDYVAVIGPSGSGKTTLMHILGCLDTATDGTYRLAGDDVSDLPERQLAPIRRKYIGFVFQSFNLIGSLSALDNVALPLLYLGRPYKEQRQRASEALAAVGLEDRLHHRPAQLSGGQQQRVAIARAVVSAAPVILADEPTGNLDSKAGRDIMEIFGQLHQQGRTILLITHNHEIAGHARRVVEMRDGRILSDRRQTT